MLPDSDSGVADETVALSKTMDLSALARERILGELEKALLKADTPSVFFEEMRKMEQLSVWFPEMEQLIGVKQNPQYHPEGDVWNHTMMVLDQAAGQKGASKNPVGFMLAALTHDFGKVITTKVTDGRIRSIGHETEGLPMIRMFLGRITNETKLIKYVLNMVELHMKPYQMARQQAGKKSTNKMFDCSLDPAGLVKFAKADHMGRAGSVPDEEVELFLEKRLKEFYETMEKPYVMGSDLVAAGLTPGPYFSELLAFSHKLRLAGVEKEDALRQTLAFAQKY